MKIVELYKTQLHVLWTWKGGPLALVWRFVLTILVAAVSFAVTAWLLPDITIDGAASAIVAVILMTVFNAVIRSLVLALVSPFSLILTGIAVLVLQVVAFLLVSRWVPGVTVNGVWAALVGSFVYAIVNTILTSVLGVDSSGSYYGTLIRAILIKQEAHRTEQPGVVIIQIDGLAYPILAGRIRAGSVNTLAGWVRERSHRLSRWEAMLPSMTSASQAGILHGNNDGIPAFRWYERDRQHLMVSSNPMDAAEMVKRISNGEGLLSNNGVSICNLLTGDAERVYLTTAAFLRDEHQGIGETRAFTAFFFSPTGYLRSFTMFVGEFVKELVQAARTRRAMVQPQMHRGLKYASMRAASNVVLRDMNTSLIIYEMYRGANVIYADFTDYDEIAHHSGPERVEALQALDGIDATIATLEKAAEDAPRPLQVHRALRSRTEPGRDLQAALWQVHWRGGAGPDERPRDRLPVGDPGGGIDVRQLVPLGSHQSQRRQRHCRARRAGQPYHRRGGGARTRGGSAAGRRVDHRRGGLREPRVDLFHGTRSPTDG